MHRIIVSSLLAFGAVPAVHALPNCAGSTLAPPLSAAQALLAPVAAELSTNATPLGSPSGVLAHAYDEAQSVDRVLLRLRVQAARTWPWRARPERRRPQRPAAYKPKTEFDNTPCVRHEPERQTHDRREFDAWMKAKGVRVLGVPLPPSSRAGVAPADGQKGITNALSRIRRTHVMARLPRLRTARHGLARVLSKLGICSRNEAAGWIAAGRVAVEGRVTKDAEFPVVRGRQRITIDGVEVTAGERVHLMLNKPRGLVTSARDEQDRETVYRCFEGAGLPWIAPVGRLDKASEGLLLFSNDPEWAACITDPETGPHKTYHVQVDRIPDPSSLARLLPGGR